MFSFVASERRESLFFSTLHQCLGSRYPTLWDVCGRGKVPQPWPEYGPVPELNSLSSRSTSEITGLHPVSAHSSVLLLLEK